MKIYEKSQNMYSHQLLFLQSVNLMVNTEEFLHQNKPFRSIGM